MTGSKSTKSARDRTYYKIQRIRMPFIQYLISMIFFFALSGYGIVILSESNLLNENFINEVNQ